MTVQTTLAKHAALVDDMGQTLGVDLEEEVLRGTLDPDTLVDSVLSCTNCTDPTACRAWMTLQDEVADVPPSYCRNTDLLLRLRDMAAER